MVKGLKVAVDKHKSNKENTFQQLMGGVEKGIGESSVIHVKHNIDQPMFKLIETFALSINLDKKEVIVRKVVSDFESQHTSVECGITPLGIEDGLNRVCAII